MQFSATLKGLSLRGNKIGHTGNLVLAGALQINSELQVLDVADTDVTLPSIIAYTTVLQNAEKLQALDISRPLLNSHEVGI